MIPWGLIIHLGAGLCLGGVFLVAGVAKIVDPVSFYHAIRDYQILPHALAQIVAWWLPWLEVSAALALAIPRTRGSAAAILGLLSLGFLGLNLVALVRNTGATCSCFGPLASIPVGVTMAIDALLCGLAFILLRLHRRPPTVDHPGEP